jgi:hypothetical protein
MSYLFNFSTTEQSAHLIEQYIKHDNNDKI